jgi:hypothetical protein
LWSEAAESSTRLDSRGRLSPHVLICCVRVELVL